MYSQAMVSFRRMSRASHAHVIGANEKLVPGSMGGASSKGWGPWKGIQLMLRLYVQAGSLWLGTVRPGGTKVAALCIAGLGGNVSTQRRPAQDIKETEG